MAGGKRRRSSVMSLDGWLPSAGRVLQEIGVQVGAGLAGRFAESYTQTKITHERRIPSIQLGVHTSYSRTDHVRSRKIATKYIGMLSDHYYLDVRNTMATNQTFQGVQDNYYLWSLQDLNAAFAALDKYELPTTTTPHSTADYLLHSCRAKTIYTNVSNLRAHVILYDIRSREGTEATHTPLLDWQYAMDQFGGAANTNENRLGIQPTISENFNKRWEILNTTAFDLNPGDEHVHEFNVKLCKNINLSDWPQGSDGSSQATGVWGGVSHATMCVLWGQLVSSDSDNTKVAVGSTRVNFLTTKIYTFMRAADEDWKTLALADTAQSTIADPRFMAVNAPAEFTPATV